MAFSRASSFSSRGAGGCGASGGMTNLDASTPGFAGSTVGWAVGAVAGAATARAGGGSGRRLLQGFCVIDRGQALKRNACHKGLKLFLVEAGVAREDGLAAGLVHDDIAPVALRQKVCFRFLSVRTFTRAAARLRLEKD